MGKNENGNYPEGLLASLKLINPANATTKQAARYLTENKGIPTTPSTLEVYRSTGRGPKFKRIGSRVFYDLAWLDEYAGKIEVSICDPSKTIREDTNACRI